MTDKKPILLIALGGNALIQKGQTGTADQQFENLNLPMKQIAELSRKYRVVITHGNGPRSEICCFSRRAVMKFRKCP